MSKLEVKDLTINAELPQCGFVLSAQIIENTNDLLYNTIFDNAFYLQFKTNTLLNRLADNMDKAGDVIKHSIYPFYQLGRAACGNIVGMLVFTAISAALRLGKPYTPVEIHGKAIECILLSLARSKQFL